MDRKTIIFTVSLIGILVISNTSLQSFAESEWQTQKIVVGDQAFRVPYKIINGGVEKIDYDNESGSIIVILTDDDMINGTIEITLPRNLIDSKTTIDEDDEFYVLLDGEESKYEEKKSDCFRTLSIEFQAGTKTIEVVVTFIYKPSGSMVPPIYISTDKNNYQQDEVITISGCTNLALDDKEIIFDVINPEGKTYKTITVVPNIDGSFSTSLVVEGEDEIDGTYIAKATYASQSATSSFVVPEFPIPLFVLLVSLIAIIFATKPRNLTPQTWNLKST